MQISKNEGMALEILKHNELEVFTTKDIKRLLGFNTTRTYNLIRTMKKKGQIYGLKNGLYCIHGTDEMIIATNVVHPSYISFLSALNYYGLTDQVPAKITLATTKRKSHDDYIYAIISKELFFGYTSIGGIVIAEKEKALIDSLYLPKYAGGIKEIIRCFAQEDFDKRKLYNYALRMKSKAVLRRLGFIMDRPGVEFDFNLGKGYELLDPSLERKHNYSKKWLLDVNI